VTLIAHIVSSIETIEPAKRPVTWFLAGAGLLDIGDTQRRGLELALIKKFYWPHGENFKRLEASTLDFRLLCPGPMVEGAAVGLDRLRVAIDRLPVQTPAAVKRLPDWLLVPIFASRVPEMIIPYADAAALMLNNLEPGNAMSRHRVGLALPAGMRGKKKRWQREHPRRDRAARLRRKQRGLGDLEGCTLRPGNVHSADGWDEVLKPVVARYSGKVSRIYFRAGWSPLKMAHMGGTHGSQQFNFA
jgi:hypothetical protein